jgi:hypothetical protein
MADRDWNPDTGGRSLAEILKEAGIESAQRSRRRRWDDPEETAIRQRRADAAAETSDRSGYGRRRSDLAAQDSGAPMTAPPPGGRVRSTPPARPADPREFRRPVAPEPTTSAIPNIRPDRKPGVPGSSASAAAAAPATTAAAAVTRERAPERAPERAAERAPERTAQRGGPEPVANRSRGRAAVEEDVHPHTGPIPVVHPDDIEEDLDGTPQESALAWLRFAGELVIALAAGVGIYFAATVLWEIVPYVAVLLVPVAVTGLVFGVGMWRRRMGHEPIGPRLLATLVFAGTLLTVAPAAGLLASG